MWARDDRHRNAERHAVVRRGELRAVVKPGYLRVTAMGKKITT
jgi:hypothetical protein